MKVLVVDDSKTMRQLIRAYIEDMGHTVLEAEDGSVAIKLFRKHYIDFVMMDVEMPGMNGFVTTARLREIDSKRWFPIVFLSSKNDPSYFVEGIESGGDAYLAKPVNGPVLQSMVRAMSRISNMQEQLLEATKNMELLANRDQLTALTNRRGFDNAFKAHLENSKRKETPLAMLMIDIDHFKQYNDTYGHIEGDKCLEKVAKTLSDNLIISTDTIARYGGEEFAVIIPNIELSKVGVIANRLCKVVEQADLPHSGSKLGVVTVSIGAAVLVPGETAEQLTERADKALYIAKNNGRNQFSIDSAQ